MAIFSHRRQRKTLKYWIVFLKFCCALVLIPKNMVYGKLRVVHLPTHHIHCKVSWQIVAHQGLLYSLWCNAAPQIGTASPPASEAYFFWVERLHNTISSFQVITVEVPDDVSVLRDMRCTVHDLEVKGSNTDWVELGVHSTSVCTWTQTINHFNWSNSALDIRWPPRSENIDAATSCISAHWNRAFYPEWIS